MKNITQIVAFFMCLLCALSVDAGIAPGSKDLGAIWFVGDSITQSNADGDKAGSPRKSLYDLLLANDYTFSYTGHHNKNMDGLPATGASVADDLYHYHSGISGIRIGELGGDRGFATILKNIWNQGRLAMVKPNVILIMLGTNDVGNMQDAPNRLKQLVADIYALPAVGQPTVFLATVPPNRRQGQARFAHDTENVVAFNSSILEIVKDFVAEGKDIHFVDQFTPLDEDYTANMRPDNLHPNGTGNETMARTWFRAIASVVGDSTPVAKPVKEFPGKQTAFKGYDRYDQIKTPEGTVFSVVCPQEAAPGKPWLWRSLFWDQIDKFNEVDLQLVEQGYHVVLAFGDVHGHPKGNQSLDAAYRYVTEKHGFSKTCSMASMSRGNLQLFRWASENPEKVESIYVDNGVCNVDSWPGGLRVEGSGSQGTGSERSWEQMKAVYGFSTDQELLDAKVSPIDLLEPLAEANVPILMICGSQDQAVPYEENDAVLEARYKALGGPIKVIIEEKGHTHGTNDPQAVLDFIQTNTQ